MTEPLRAAGRRLRLCLIVLAVAVSAFAVFAASASAKVHSLHFQFNAVVSNLGSLKGAKVVDPNATPPDPPATMDGTLNQGGSGDFTVPPDGFVFPTKTFHDVVVPGLNATVALSTDQPITGSFNPGTGAATATMTLNGSISLSGLITANCQLAGAPLTLSTTGTLVDDTDPLNPVNFDAAAFKPPSGNGALVGLWDSLPPLTGDSFCPVLSQIVGGPGGIWLSGNATRG
jgi:hypothetical protein